MIIINFVIIVLAIQGPCIGFAIKYTIKITFIKNGETMDLVLKFLNNIQGGPKLVT